MHDTWKYWYEEHPTAEAQRRWLLRLQCAFSPSCAPVVVCKEVNTERLRLPEAILTYQLPVNHRVILKNEIVIEYDSEEQEKNKEATHEVIAWLRRRKIPYVVGWSGNKSYHVHVWIDVASITFSADTAEWMKTLGLTAADFRNYVYQKFFYKRLKDIETKTGAKLDETLHNRNHLIREFGGVNQKTGKRKTFINDELELPHPLQVIYPQGVEFWHVPEWQEVFFKFLSTMEKQKKKETLEGWFA